MTILAIGALTALVYTYFGYPALIAILARSFGQRTRTDDGYLPPVSALIPVYNGAAYLEAKVNSLAEQDYPQEKFQILLYLDGCSDESLTIAQRLASQHGNVEVIESAVRTGKPTGLNTMAAQATGEVYLMTDIRQPVVSGAVRRLVAALADPTVACASGNLELHGATGAGVYWRYENWIRRNEGAFRSMVGATGPLYAIRRSAFHSVPAGIILDDMWLPMKARLDGFRTVFVEDAVATDDAFGDKREFGRKTRTLAGAYQLFARMPALLVPVVNPSWLETISHKLLRLLSPWMLLTLLATSTIQAIRGNCYLTILAGCQGAFYVAAVLGPKLGRIGTVARSFTMMNIAALVGLYRFLTGGQKVTW